jgi:predicted nucleic acid-binding protein
MTAKRPQWRSSRTGVSPCHGCALRSRSTRSSCGGLTSRPPAAAGHATRCWRRPFVAGAGRRIVGRDRLGGLGAQRSDRSGRHGARTGGDRGGPGRAALVRPRSGRVVPRAGGADRRRHQCAGVGPVDSRRGSGRVARCSRCRPGDPRRLASTVDELEDVLARDRFRAWVSLEKVDEYVGVLRQRVELVDDPGELQAVSRDPDDDYLIALARAATVDALVSGDEDLTSLELDDLRIVSPRQVLDRLR